MRYLYGEEKINALEWFLYTSELALNANCERSLCGSIIIKNNELIGEGVNGPPKNKESQRKCGCHKNEYDMKVTDKTCCVHAEQRAIMNALETNPMKIKDSRLYFIRLDKNDSIIYAKEPYCTICSKLALDIGIKEFVLFHKKGICVYDTEEYNLLSYNYGKLKL